MNPLGLFLVLAPGADPRTDRKVLDEPDHETLVVWVPDVAAAAEVAATETAAGIRLVELYGGFDAAATAAVTAAVDGRAAVGTLLAVSARSAPGAKRTATIYDAPTDAAGIGHELADGRRTEIRPAPDADTAVALARRLVDEGVELVQICGGAPIGTAVAVAAALGDRAAVTATVWPFDALAPAAVFAAEHSPHADQFVS